MSTSHFTRRFVAAATLALVALAGCKLPKLDHEKKSDDDDTETASTSKKKAKGDSTASASAADGPVWTEEITGETKKMARTDLTPGDMKDMSILAPEGAKVKKSLGGVGAEIEDSAYGYLVWVHEDPSATFDLMKQATTAWNKDAKFVKEDKTSLIISQPSYDGSASFYYKGIYKSGSKTIICETPSSIAPTKQSHAEQIQKACNSLQMSGKSIASDAPAADASAAPSAVAANDTPAAAPAAGGQNAPSQNADAAKAQHADQQNQALNDAFGGGNQKPAQQPASQPATQPASQPATQPASQPVSAPAKQPATTPKPNPMTRLKKK